MELGEGAPVSQPAAPGRILDDSFLRFLPGIIREPRRQLLAVVVAWLLAFVGSLLIAAILAKIVPDARQPDFSAFIGKGMFTVTVVAILSPLVETLILAGTTAVLLKFVKPANAIVISSFGWAIAHSLQAPIWGLVIFWPFVIFSTLFVVWKQRSLLWAIAMPFAAHFLQNIIPAVSIGYPGLISTI